MNFDWFNIFTTKEIVRLYDTTDRHHPLITLLSGDAHGQVKANTERAAKTVFGKAPDWLKKLRNRLLSSSDFTNVSSALGEIRTYGWLLETGIHVMPEPNVNGKLPDFEVNAGDGAVIVEVHSRQLDEAEVKNIEAHRNEANTIHKAAI